MKRRLAVIAFAAVVLTSGTFAASAQTPALSAGSDTPAKDQPVADADGRLTVEAEKKVDRHCLRHTGSRLLARTTGNGRRCAATGRVYTREDLDSTGAVNLADALRMLDPSIR